MKNLQAVVLVPLPCTLPAPWLSQACTGLSCSSGNPAPFTGGMAGCPIQLGTQAVGGCCCYLGNQVAKRQKVAVNISPRYIPLAQWKMKPLKAWQFVWSRAECPDRSSSLCSAHSGSSASPSQPAQVSLLSWEASLVSNPQCSYCCFSPSCLGQHSMKNRHLPFLTSLFPLSPYYNLLFLSLQPSFASQPSMWPSWSLSVPSYIC